MARSFREAEEASNAQGTVQGALDFAMQNAKANPTPANIAIMKDTAAARQATVAANDPGKLVPTVTIGGAPAGYTPKALADAQASAAQVSSTLSEVDKAIADVNTAGKEAGDIAASMGGTGWQDVVGGTGGTGGKPGDSGISDTTRDAFATMGLLLQQWGLEGLADTYSRLMAQGLSAGEALTKLKYDKTIDPVTGKPWNAAYSTRFAGNVARVAAGMNAYDEATYLDVENSYDETLRKYGLTNLINPDKSKAQAQYADYMAKGLAPTEFKDRIQTVAEKVLNMDPSIKAQFQTYYPSLTNTDLVSYFLDPAQTLPVLKSKVTAAEIGAVAKTTGSGINEARAMELGQFGVTREAALTAYPDIAEVTPTANKLSNIYNEEGITYGQTQAEDEFLKQDARAKLNRNRLASKERAMFGGSNNISLDRSIQGKF
jgi:hypothetical protein